MSCLPAVANTRRCGSGVVQRGRGNAKTVARALGVHLSVLAWFCSTSMNASVLRKWVESYFNPHHTRRICVPQLPCHRRCGASSCVRCATNTLFFSPVSEEVATQNSGTASRCVGATPGSDNDVIRIVLPWVMVLLSWFVVSWKPEVRHRME